MRLAGKCFLARSQGFSLPRYCTHFTKTGGILRTQTELILFTRCICRTPIYGAAIKRSVPCLSITVLISARELFRLLGSCRGGSRPPLPHSAAPVRGVKSRMTLREGIGRVLHAG